MLDQFTPGDADQVCAGMKLGARAKGKWLGVIRAFLRSRAAKMAFKTIDDSPRERSTFALTFRESAGSRVPIPVVVPRYRFAIAPIAAPFEGYTEGAASSKNSL